MFHFQKPRPKRRGWTSPHGHWCLVPFGAVHSHPKYPDRIVWCPAIHPSSLTDGQELDDGRGRPDAFQYHLQNRFCVFTFLTFLTNPNFICFQGVL